MRPVSRHRHFWPITIAITTIALTMASLPAYAALAGKTHDEPAPAAVAHDEPEEHTHHDDPARKNAISRAPESANTEDPTTPTQAIANTGSVVAQRSEPEPTLVPTATPAPRASAPQDRYAMAGGCYALQSASTGKWVVPESGAYAAKGSSLAGAIPFHFQATDLGTYLLYGPGKTFLSANLLTRPSARGAPSSWSDWTVTKTGPAFTFTLPSKNISNESPGFTLCLKSTS